MKRNLSRSQRLSDAMVAVETAKEEIETLTDELQNWLDGMPENLQSGSKAEQLEDTITALGEVGDALDTALSDADDVEFPGMF